jgi:hypothetical protein
MPRQLDRTNRTYLGLSRPRINQVAKAQSLSRQILLYQVRPQQIRHRVSVGNRGSHLPLRVQYLRVAIISNQ